MGEYRIITIGREFGSGGHEIGEQLAKELGIAFYDDRLVTMAMQEAGIHTDQLKESDEKKPNALRYKMLEQPNEKTGYMVPVHDAMFRLQFEIITKLAKEKRCVIVGRCADYILRGRVDVLSVFIFGDMEKRTERIIERKQLDKKAAVEQIKKTDRQRKNYYNYYTDLKWSKKESYAMVLNSSVLGIDNCVKILKGAVKESGISEEE